MNFRQISEQSFMIYFKSEISEDVFENVNFVVDYLRSKNHPYIQEVVPSYRAILVYFDGIRITFETLIEELELNQLNYNHEHNAQGQRRIINLPVLYGGKWGPDIDVVAAHNQLSIEQVIQYHTEAFYLVYMIGFMPGFPDLQGFGRRNLDMSLKEIFNMVVYQVGALKTFCDIQGVKLNHVKPHGALYQMASRNADIAKAIASAIHQIDPKLYLMGLSNSILIEEGRKQGLNVASEVFADRRYENDGQLVSRKKEGAVIEVSHEAIEQVLQTVKEGTVKTISGEIIDIKADTICVHGDGAHALDFVKQIRSHLSDENVDISTLGG
ncbi:5-oxoprolinase subunit PxpA [Staphylococcus coagulans]|uniref:5-oxoprolinase subunit PxpA n=1 Tax=Staphylococcus coagulans TaxID=74706 RepID=UPI001FDA33B1|nr:5-oxoprolinase subunit PxpA [Staphylococcus coagulans]